MRHESNTAHKENKIPLDRRLSLKFGSAANNKNSSRMSIPMRRQSMATCSSFYLNNQENPRDYRQSLVSNASTYSRQTKKSAILTNLVNKLDHEQQLKEIIQSKIKNTETDYPPTIIKNNNNYNYHQNSNIDFFENKVRAYESQIEGFQQIVTELVNKINMLEKNRNYAVKTQECGVQTEDYSVIKSKQGQNFMDNLDRTMRVLSGKKIR